MHGPWSDYEKKKKWCFLCSSLYVIWLYLRICCNCECLWVLGGCSESCVSVYGCLVDAVKVVWVFMGASWMQWKLCECLWVLGGCSESWVNVCWTCGCSLALIKIIVFASFAFCPLFFYILRENQSFFIFSKKCPMG